MKKIRQKIRDIGAVYLEFFKALCTVLSILGFAATGIVPFILGQEVSVWFFALYLLLPLYIEGLKAVINRIDDKLDRW